LNFEELTKAAREAAQWERSNRDKRPKLIFLGHYGPLPHLARAHSVKLVIDERLNETHIPFITETIKEATYKSKKLVIEFPYKYPNPDDSVITLLNHLKHPMKLRIAERDLFRAKNSGLKLDSVNSLVITFNRSLYLKREIISNNPNEWNLEVIKTIVPLQNLQQLTVSSNATTQMFLAPKLRGFDNLTDLTIDEFDLPLRKINKESFPELKFLRLVDPKIRDYQAQADSPEELLFSGFIPCPVTTLTIKYYKASHAIHCYPDLKYIFPQLTEITVIGQYVPSGALLVIQNNLHIPKLRLLGCVLFGNLTVIITGTKTYAGVSGMTGNSNNTLAIIFNW